MVHAGDGDLAGRGRRMPAIMPQGRGLAGAVGAEEAEQLPARHFDG